MMCAACGTVNDAGRKFCGGCGAPLALICAACGSANPSGVKFCGECGGSVATAVDASLLDPGERSSPLAVVAERRLVSVLFADLVGFTALSEGRDAEEVRDLLSRYFDAARRLVERYGGVVEKFIGDAVMAVWGAPAAQEDDAERAVRTALDLVAAVSALGDEFGSSELRLRAGVMTGEAAVTLGASGQGMVAGDLVNTASRVQALAEPGTVCVGEVTRRASEAAIAYEDMGVHEVKGRTQPVQVHRALRVIAARRGEGRTVGLEAPFVGREREFRLVKELFHVSAEERRARMVSIVGVAGIGKSRLSWEFEKYIDGLADDVLWHRGRCLAYGEGVAYWGLAEMVRMRARIAEDDPPEVAWAKLRATLESGVPSPTDREFLEPRLAHLIGLAQRTAPDKEDLFSAWRLFFERLAEQAPVVLVFEDLQWADTGLLDFIEYLLDWSRSFPLYLLTLSRPELSTRRPSLGTGHRHSTSLFLEALRRDEIATLLEGLVPGLPAELRSRIVERADGVPLYAVETVRMLLDRKVLERAGDRYRVTGAVEALDVPETLHALVAARLDGLEADERRLLCDASVLGKSFTREGLAALSGVPADQLEPLVVSLLRKEIVTVQSDPRSPERGQLSFMQDLLRRVTYETMSRRERKARHLAAAAHLEADAVGDEELAGIVASHYLDAYRADEQDADAPELKAKARSMLVRAGERAASLAAAAEATAYLQRAVELCDEPGERAPLLERAGAAALQSGDAAGAAELFTEAIALLEAIDQPGTAARVAARLADALRFQGRSDEAMTLLQGAYTALSGGPQDADLAVVAAQFARLAFFVGNPDTAIDPIELALDLAEALKLPEVLAEALNTKGVMLYRRATESEALIRQAVMVAITHDLPPAALRAQYNLAGLFMEHDRHDEAAEVLRDALELARKRGYRAWELQVITQLADSLSSLGSWDKAIELSAEIPDTASADPMVVTSWLLAETRIALGRGTHGRVRGMLQRLGDLRTSGTEVQDQSAYLIAEAIVARAEGRFEDAIEAGRRAFDLSRSIFQLHYAAEAFVEATEAALDMGDLDTARQIIRTVEGLEPIQHRPSLDAQTLRLRARLAQMERATGADSLFREATAAFRRLKLRFWLAVTLLEHATQLIHADRSADAEPLLAESAQLFTALDAQPWLDRLATIQAEIDTPAVAER
jgi:class 3 adenylate cyclase/tetratricopeptide (TPR) repeat protein